MEEQILAVDENRDVTGQQDITKYIRYAKVTKVYDASTLAESDKYGKVDLVWLDTLDPVNGSIDVIKPFFSTVYGCGIYALPCVNDIAVCVHQQDGPPVIIGFLAKDQFLAATTADSNGFGQIGYVEPIKSGEIVVKGKSQSYTHFKNDGTIHVVAVDGTTRSTVLSEDNVRNTEPVYERPVADRTNTLVDLTIGSPEETVGPDAGCSYSVFDLKTGRCIQASITVDATQGQTQFSLPVADGQEVVSVDSLNILEFDTQSKSYKTSASFSSGVKLFKNYTYLSKELGDYGATKNPCTLDINHSFAYVEITPNIVGYIGENSKVHINYTYRVNDIRIAGNDLGDLFMDARNLVMRANGNSSYLGLFADGSVRLGGTSVEVGDRLHGHISTGVSGVELSAGVSKTARVTTVQPEEAYYSVGPVTFFYIDDSYPLFYYDADERKYGIVTPDVYGNLNYLQRCDILPRNFSSDDSVESFTKEMAREVMGEAESAGESVISYGELKAL